LSSAIRRGRLAFPQASAERHRSETESLRPAWIHGWSTGIPPNPDVVGAVLATRGLLQLNLQSDWDTPESPAPRPLSPRSPGPTHCPVFPAGSRRVCGPDAGCWSDALEQPGTDPF